MTFIVNSFRDIITVNKVTSYFSSLISNLTDQNFFGLCRVNGYNGPPNRTLYYIPENSNANTEEINSKPKRLKENKASSKILNADRTPLDPEITKSSGKHSSELLERFESLSEILSTLGYPVTSNIDSLNIFIIENLLLRFSKIKLPLGNLEFEFGINIFLKCLNQKRNPNKAVSDEYNYLRLFNYNNMVQELLGGIYLSKTFIDRLAYSHPTNNSIYTQISDALSQSSTLGFSSSKQDFSQIITMKPKYGYVSAKEILEKI